MLVARFALNTEEIDIEGDFDGLIKLTKDISEVLDEGTISLSYVDPIPYDRALKVIHVKKENGKDTPVKILVNGDTLDINGSAQNLEILIQNIRFLISQGVDSHSSIQNHIHIEYYEGHRYLSSQSAAVTVSFRSTHAA